MPVHIEGHSSNKASKKAGPQDPEHILQKVKLGGVPSVWRSFPLPDKIAFKTLLAPEHFQTAKASKDVSHAQIVGLAEGLIGASKTHGGSSPPAKWLQTTTLPKALRFTVKLGLREATVLVEIRRHGSLPPQFELYLEFNPRKLGIDGCKAVHELLAYAAPINVDAILRDARVVRLDVAIDFVGVKPVDFLVSVQKPGKRQEIFGRDGQLESIYFYAAKKLPTAPLKTSLRKPLGSLVARVYDRNAERRASGKKPPYPGYTTTRVEVSKTKFKPPLDLAKLYLLGDQFAGVRIDLALAQLGPTGKGWERYWAARRTFGTTRAAVASETSSAQASAIEEAIMSQKSKLLPTDVVWEGWFQGLVATGLGYLVHKASSATNAKSALAAAEAP